MNWIHPYRALIERIETALKPPAIKEVLLPIAAPLIGESDEFGFVVLEDGSVGPFYVCLGDTYVGVAEFMSRQGGGGLDTISVARGVGSGRLAESALGLGAFNALSQHLMRRAGFDPKAVGKGAEAEEKAVLHVGMVGYFRPLTERLLARGLRVTVIEKLPQRVPADRGVEVFRSPAALAGCDRVLCTASVLINGSIDSILAACSGRVPVEVIGPSASGLPDPLFERGVVSMGGVVIEDAARLKEAMAEGKSWRAVGRKYQLTPAYYPGAAELIAHAVAESRCYSDTES
jgi:uncharacterized protein (DUF4213/DUF364 family)